MNHVVDPQRKLSRRLQLAVSAASFLLALVAAEAVVRAVAPQARAVPFSQDMEGVTCGLPNVRGRHAVPGLFDVTISFNSQHFRGRKEFSPEPRPGVQRLAMLGDSFTWGYGANDDATYPAQLERVLEVRSGRDRVEVINAGFPGYSPGEGALFYDVWVKRFRPSVVILNLIVNDPIDEVRNRLFVSDANGEASPRPASERIAARRLRFRVRGVIQAVPGVPFLLEHSHLMNLLRSLASERVGQQETPVAGALENDGDQLEDIGIRMIMGEVKWLRRRVQESGARLIVVFLPDRGLFYDPPPSVAQWETKKKRRYERFVPAMREFCAQEAIPFIEVAPRFRQRIADLNQPAFYQAGFEDHPNALGYRLFGEIVAEARLREGLVVE